MAKFKCLACKREFEAELAEVEAAGGHLCIAADQGLSQKQALKVLKESRGTGRDQ